MQGGVGACGGWDFVANRRADVPVWSQKKIPPAGGQYLGAEIPVFTLKGYATPFVCLELHLIALQMLPFNYINNYTRATLPHKHKNLNHLQHDEEQREKDARSYASQ